MRETLAALPRTEMLGLVIFSLIIVAFMVSAWLSRWKSRWRTKK